MAILDRLDLRKIFDSATSAGFPYCDLYVEVMDTSSLQVSGKIEETWLARHTGAALRCFDGKVTRMISSPELTTESLIKRLRIGSQRDMLTESKSDLDSAHFTHAPELTAAAQLARRFMAEAQSCRGLQISFESRRKTFEIATSAGTRATGSEQGAHWNAEWQVERQGKLKPHRFSQSSGNIDNLLCQLQTECFFSKRLNHTSSANDPWPAPQGEVPLLWSPRAYAKLSLNFLRAFEGDLVLANHSFLTRLASAPNLPFRIVEEEAPDLLYDYEGSPRRALTLYSEGRPRGLACNNFVAHEMSVASTGHCRRESFQTPPTVALWAPRITGQYQDDALLPHLAWGLSIQDIDVLRFNLKTGDIRLRFSASYLIHNGQEGERVEPVVLDTNLVELLGFSHVFRSKSEPIGLSITKQSQRLITEVHSPEVLSRPFPFPGSVPLSHYW